MKICLFGVPGANVGKRSLKDPRLDAAHKLVEAAKKTSVSVDAATMASPCDAIVGRPTV
jgi:hypothetical protein